MYITGTAQCLFMVFQKEHKRGSRDAARAAKSLRWSVKQLLKYLIRTKNISAYSNIYV